MSAIDSMINLFCLTEAAAVEGDGDSVMEDSSKTSPPEKSQILGAMRDGFAAEPGLKLQRLDALTNYFTGQFKA